MIRVSLLIIAVALAVSSPVAASLGPHSVEVAADCVTVRDLLAADAAAGVGEDILDRVVLSGLRPGEQRVLTPAEIHLRLSELGIDPNSYGWSWPHSIAVTRLSQVVSAADLIAAGEQAVRRELHLFPGDAASITPVTKPRPLLAPVGDISLEAIIRPPGLPGGLWIADVTGRLDGAPVLDCTLRYRVRITGKVLVARHSLRRGEALTADDFLQQTRDLTRLRGEPLRTADELVGRRTTRAASSGTILTTEWIELIPLVRRGQLVTAFARAGAVRATARVVALSDGGMGDIIRVRTDAASRLMSRSKREFLVRISAPGRAEVITSP